MAKRRSMARAGVADLQIEVARQLVAQHLGHSAAPMPGQPSAMMGGGYQGARIDRAQLSRWQVAAGSPRSDLSTTDLSTLRGRSRDQMRNAPVAVGAINTAIGHIVGTGLSCTPAVAAERLGLSAEQAQAWQDDVRWRFGVWAASVDCDVERQQNLYGKQELFQRTWLESGDAFALTPVIERNGRRSLAIQLVEADRVCNPNRTANTDLLCDGVELDPVTREALHIHVARRHPGDLLGAANQWDRVAVRGGATGRRNVLHGFKPLRPGQVRGVPWVAPILEPLKQLQRWSDAELNAAVVSSIFSVFIKMDPQAFGDIYDEEAQEDLIGHATDRATWSREMESGKAVNLLPGESIEAPPPGRPNPAFDPFWTSMVRQIGMALELPFEVLVMHFQSSYSAARAALLMAWKMFRSRRDLLVSRFCQPIYELWLEDDVANNRTAAPGFFADPMIRAAWCAAVWTGDGPGSIDPEQEVRAAKERVALEISTLDAESILHDGIDWQTKHRQRVREIAAQKRDGTWSPPAGAPAPAPGGKRPNADADDNTDEADQAGDEGAPDDGNNSDRPDKPKRPTRQQADAMAASLQAMASLASALGDAATRQPSVSVSFDATQAGMEAAMGRAVDNLTQVVKNMPIIVNVPAPVVHVAGPNVTVEAPQVSFEATLPAAQVVVQGPKSSEQTIERDAQGELLKTITTHQY